MVSPNLDINRIWQNVLGLPSAATPSSSSAQSIYAPTTTSAPNPVTTTIATPLDLSSLPSLFSQASSTQQQLNILPSNSSSTTTALLSSHQLYQHGMCTWPHCVHPCKSFAIFIQHLHKVHIVGERSTQQCQEQIELIESLEHRLAKERSRLLAMMHHLHMNPSPDSTQPSLNGTPTHQLQQQHTPTHYQMTAALQKQQQNETSLLQAKLSSIAETAEAVSVVQQQQHQYGFSTPDNMASLLMVMRGNESESGKLSVDSKQVNNFF